MTFKSLLILSLPVLLMPSAGLSQQVYINEVMSSNSTTIADEDGDYEDWIELYNAGQDSVNLQGFGLSDNYSNPFKWTFPDVSMPPGAFLLVWASGKDRSDPAGALHTGYSISASGEEVILTDTAGRRLDELEPTAIPTDYSIGRFPDGIGEWYFYENPTPGAANSDSAWTGLTEIPAFSRPPGFYEETFDLELISDDPNAVIYFTRDGSIPTTSSSVYEEPIVIDDRELDPNDLSNISTTPPNLSWSWEPPKSNVYKGYTIRAIAVSEGQRPSEVVSSSYFVHPEGNNRYSFPVISLQTDRENLFDDEIGIYVPGNAYTGSQYSGNYYQSGWERTAHLEFFEPDGAREIAQDVGIRIHGGGTRRHPQKTLRIYARSDYGESEISYNLIPGNLKQGSGEPLDRYKRLLLRPSGDDWRYTMFKDAMIQSLYEGRKVDRQAYRPSVVFINGEYWGIHNIRERYDGWYIQTNYDIHRDDVAILNGNAMLENGEYSDVTRYVNMRNFAINEDLSQPEPYEHISTLMDVDNYVEYMGLQLYISNSDWPHGNIRFWRKRTESYEPDAPYGADGRWRWMIYDLDGSFSYPYRVDDWAQYDQNMFEWVTGQGNPRNSGTWVNALFENLIENEEFKNKLITHLADDLNTRFSSDHVTERINQFRELYSPEIQEHASRYPRSTTGLNLNWEAHVESHIEFAEKRPDYLRSHIREFFNIEEEFQIAINLSDIAGGFVKVNSMEITGATPGISEPAYPWIGTYFQGIPVELEAVSWPGYKFSHWDINGDTIKTSLITLSMESDKGIIAVFTEDEQADLFPEAHILSDGDFNFTTWHPETEPGSYPDHMAFVFMNEDDPALSAEIEGFTEGAYNLESRTRINGLGDGGISFINTANEEGNPGYPGTRLGGALMALDTRGHETVSVSWAGSTIQPNSRVYNLRLRYRIGNEGPFSDVIDASGFPVEYRRNELAGHTQFFDDIRLPAVAGNKRYVQLLWQYYYTGERLDEESGQRAQLSLSDISVTNNPLSYPGDNEEELPLGYELLQNYPNPFNPVTEIVYKLPEPSEVTLEVFSIQGQRVAVLESGMRGPGEHSVRFDASRLSSGVYIYRLHAGSEIITRKMTLIK